MCVSLYISLRIFYIYLESQFFTTADAVKGKAFCVCEEVCRTKIPFQIFFNGHESTRNVCDPRKHSASLGVTSGLHTSCVHVSFCTRKARSFEFSPQLFFQRSRKHTGRVRSKKTLRKPGSYFQIAHILCARVFLYEELCSFELSSQPFFSGHESTRDVCDPIANSIINISCK